MTRNEMEFRAEKKRYENAVRGCMVGGGAGDALGYPVEFWSENEIRRTYGESGITSYQCSPEEGLAVVSDDTQM
ncbi:MAG: ADP-ribosylglycohydrolase family protein, partial [Lachnospiraceae bacterium]|nr:ADP-ribosylglycohydrolase family protein [Lachnospiraceae bacterium]